MTLFFPFWIFVFHSHNFFVSVVHLSDREGGFWLSAEHSRREVTPLILKASAWDAPHTPLYTSPLAIPLSSLPFCPPSIHPLTRCPLQSDLAQTNQRYTRGRDCVNQIKRAPFTPPGKKVLKFLILTKIPQWKQILFIPCPRRTTAKWNREAT